jgi:anti-anti-sigma factor
VVEDDGDSPVETSDREGGLVVEPGDDGTLRLVGGLDAVTEDVLLEQGRAAVGAGTTTLVLDCAGLRFCDSAGLRALVLLGREVGSPLVLRNASPTLSRLLEVTGLSPVFVVE